MAVHTLSLCTGVGGIELGLELALPGVFTPICYVEGEIPCAALLAERMDRLRACGNGVVPLAAAAAFLELFAACVGD